jgi:hypothetical protein
MSLCIVLDAGLGNQLFMLFAGISKAIDEKRDFSIFPIYNTFRQFYFTNLLKSLLFKVAPNTNNIHKNDFYEEPYFHYKEIPNNKKLIKGYFQSPKYFHHNKDKILEILKIDKYKNKNKLSFKAIALHFRFGDMTVQQGNHAILTPYYFINAIKKMKELVLNWKDYSFVIFAEKNDNDLIDDYIETINNNLEEPITFIKFYELYLNTKDYEDLFYMSSCEHFIIANSSYSWFAAYFNDNKNKQVLYPCQWFGINLCHNITNDLFMDNWIKINY